MSSGSDDEVRHPRNPVPRAPQGRYEPKVANAALTTNGRSGAFDITEVSRYPVRMLVEENMLKEYRGDDGLCRLKPDYGGPYRYADYPKLLATLTEAAKRPNLMRDGRLKTVFTWNYFDELSDSVDHGVVAMLAFTDVVPVLPITRNWMAFQHQGAGYACRQVTVISTVIEPKPAIKSALTEIARSNYYALGGRFEGPETDPETTERYIADIENLGLTCGDQELSELCESVYPVDANPSSMNICFEDIGDLIYLTEDERAKPLVLFLSSNSD
ncbi:hypothetical protein [Phaeobacter sp. LSS9]|uniref:hypothetical protein n=1 Tax=unclassified Phaeobacter TaxID=2621772 RepID=UPI0013C2C3C7|nr:hypothetical protein [Phaeobacter sp. LSS9]